MTFASTALVTAWACGDPAPSQEPSAPAAAPTESTANAPPSAAELTLGSAPSNATERSAALEARTAAQRLGGALKTRLLAEMAEGPVSAARFCADNAQAMTGGVAEDTGVRVGRSSSRLRNPANAGPQWVRAWLQAQEGRDPASIAPATAVEDGVARFVAPIRVAGPCLVCHGAPDSFDPALRSELAERYPDDRATGYALGDLRGALWAEAEVAPSETAGPAAQP